jgi:hypothetical protein
LLKKDWARLAMPPLAWELEGMSALGWSDGDMGGALFGRREIEGVDCVADGVTVGVGELAGAGGILASSPSAFLLGVLEKGRRHLNGNLEAVLDSVKVPKGDCASRRLDIVLLMALLLPNPSLEL